MRITTIATLTTLSCALAFAGDAHTVTYIAGNLSGVMPTSGATLQVAGKALSLRSGGKAVEIPYSSISKAEVSDSVIKGNTEPIYKVWALRKRLAGNNEMQQVMVDFKESSGETRSITLEMQRATATDVIAAIDYAQTHGNGNSTAWWGDKYWKTKSNPELSKQ